MLKILSLGFLSWVTIFTNLVSAESTSIESPIILNSPVAPNISPTIPTTIGAPVAVPILPTNVIPALEIIPPRGSGQDTFASLPIEVLWTKISSSHGNAIIGIKKPGSARGVWKSTRLISQADVESYIRQIMIIAGVSSIVYRDSILPFIVAKLENQTALAAILSLPFIDYVEPGSLEIQPMGIGCAIETASWISILDTSGDIIPRVFPYNSIDRAWKRNVSGKGINIGVVDTGLFRNQKEFWPDRFSSSTDYVRSVRYNFCTTKQCLDQLPDSVFDNCGHGTRIAGAITAPKNGTNIVGVAFGANLHAVKVADGVWSDDPITDLNHILGIRAVRDAGARIIQMAFGGTFTSNAMLDTIMIEYYRTDRPEVLFIAAAGTQICPLWAPVAFPARMSEVLAVTGVNRDGEEILGKGIFTEGRNCFGPQVDLAAVLEDFETTGENIDSVITLGGSSGASALVSGIAALVWSQNPSMTRSQVIDRLQKTAWKSPALGVNVVNAYAATGGILTASIVGPTEGVTQDQTFKLDTIIVGDGPYTYKWDRGETTSSVIRTGPGRSSVTVKDTIDGHEVHLRFETKPRQLVACSEERTECMHSAHSGTERGNCVKSYERCIACTNSSTLSKISDCENSISH